MSGSTSAASSCRSRAIPSAATIMRSSPGWPLHRYGIEQQAEIVRHAFLLRHGARVPGAPPLAQYETLLPFAPPAP